MSKYFLKIPALLFFILVISSCEKYDFPEPPYPSVTLLGVDQTPQEGAFFRARLRTNNGDPITQHGFVLGERLELNISEDRTVELGPLTTNETFETFVNSGLIEGRTYAVKAFIQTADLVVYSEPFIFESRGSANSAN